MKSSVSAWLLLLVALHKNCGPGSQTEAVNSVPHVPAFSGPSYLPTVPGNFTPQNGFYPVDTASTDFENPFPMPSHMSHVLSIMDDNDANEIVAHDMFYSYMEEKPHSTASSPVSPDIPSHSLRVSSLPAELSASSVQAAQEPEASVDFMLHHQAMDNISHADTMIPPSLDVASSLLEDHSPPPSLASFSPAAPEVSSPTLSKTKIPRVTTTTTRSTTRSTTTTTRPKKGGYASSVKAAEEPDARVDFMLPHQAMDNISHADTMIPPSLDVASSLLEDHSPPPSLASSSPAAPEVSSPTLSKTKIPRVTTTTTRSTTRSTTTTTRPKKGGYTSSVKAAQEPEASANFMLPHQAMDNIRHAGTMIPPSLDVASSLLEDHSPPPSLASSSPAAPEVSSPTLSKTKIPRVTTTTTRSTTRSTTTTTRPKKGGYTSSVKAAQEPEASANFMLPHQAMDNIRHAGTMIPPSLDVASSLLEDHSPPPSLASSSPAAPEVSSPTLSKTKIPRVTTTTTRSTTRSTTTTTRPKKGASVPETKDGSSNTTTDSKTTHEKSASPDLFAKFTSSTSSTTTTTATTGLTPTTGTITTTTTTATTTTRTALGSAQTRNVCTLFQFFVNQFLRTLSRCQELVGSDESEKQQMQEKMDTPTGESTKHESVEDDLDFTFESLAEQFFSWAESLLQWLTAVGRTLQSDANSPHDIFLKMSPEKAS